MCACGSVHVQEGGREGEPSSGFDALAIFWAQLTISQTALASNASSMTDGFNQSAAAANNRYAKRADKSLDMRNTVRFKL